LTVKEILQILEAADKSGFDTFEMTNKEFGIKLSRGQNLVSVVPAVQAAPATVAPVLAPAESAPAAEEKTTGVAGAKEVNSPLVGIFHPLAKPVKIGDKLKKGDVICMVEAMKLMNEIVMPEDGEIVWIAGEDGDTVEFGQLICNYI
jgi:acetyl-CoA carboxylase biotin carboxyl carrier protein